MTMRALVSAAGHGHLSHVGIEAELAPGGQRQVLSIRALGQTGTAARPAGGDQQR
jgi:hypothetical protein